MGIQWNRPRLALLCAVLGLSACDRFTPDHIAVGRADTVVVNNIRPTQLAAHVISRSGDTLTGATLSWRLAGRSTHTLSDDGVVDCSWRGNVDAVVNANGLSKRFTVLCRPIMMLYFAPSTPLTLGGPPVPYQLSAVGPDGQAVMQIAGTVTLKDTSLMTMRDGLLIARAVGEARVRVAAGDCDSEAPVLIEQPVASSDSLARYRPHVTQVSLVPGEMRQWRLPPGLAYITLEGDTTSAGQIALAAARANCARLKRGLKGISCMVNDSSVILVRHEGRAPIQTARLRMEAQRHPDSTPPRYPRGRSGRQYCSMWLASNLL